MGTTDEPERVALTVPLERVGSAASGRARLAAIAWTVGLAGIAWIGLSGHDAGPVVAPVPLAAAPTAAAHLAAGPTAPRIASAPVSTHDPGRRAAPPIVLRHGFGEDGLIGGIVFGDNVPRATLTQADIERDGFRYYGQLLVRGAGTGH